MPPIHAALPKAKRPIHGRSRAREHLSVDVVGRPAGQLLAHGGGQGSRGAMIGSMGSAVGSDAVAGGAAGPGAGGIVSRPRLFERLGASARVTVVSAPPGSGKTVLLRSWISQPGAAGSAAWVMVRRGERDPQQVLIDFLGLPARGAGT